jgi:hypothetical protein
MWENQSPETPAEPEVIKPTYEELEETVAKVKAEMSALAIAVDTYRSRATKLQGKIDSVDEWITEEAEMLSDRQVEELCDLLGLESSTTKTMTLEITVEVEITAPRGFDFDDISEYDFEVEVSKASSADWEIESTDSSINSMDVN